MKAYLCVLNGTMNTAEVFIFWMNDVNDLKLEFILIKRYILNIKKKK